MCICYATFVGEIDNACDIEFGMPLWCCNLHSQQVEPLFTSELHCKDNTVTRGTARALQRLYVADILHAARCAAYLDVLCVSRVFAAPCAYCAGFCFAYRFLL